MVMLSPAIDNPPQSGGLSIREQLAATWCETAGRPLLVAKNAVLHHAIIFRPNCKRWSCDYCGGQRTAWCMVMAGYGHEQLAASGQEIGFMTITSHPKIRTTSQGIYVWRKAWPKLLRRLKRASDVLAYLQIPEQHKSGAYHVHIMTTSKVSERWIKDNAAQCGFGYIDEFAPVRDAGKAAWYVAKYLTKESHKLSWPKYFRRFNTSRNWPRPPPIEKSDQWAVTMQKKDISVQAIRDVLQSQEWIVDVFTS